MDFVKPAATDTMVVNGETIGTLTEINPPVR